MVAPFDADQRAALQAAIDEIIPPEHDHQGGWRDGVESYLDTEWHGVLDWAHELVTSAVGALTARPSLSALEQTQQDALIRIAHEGFYAAPHLKEPPGWRVVGFSPIPEGVQAIEPDPLPIIALSAADETYDTIVVGAGTGGGVVAAMLADAGERVLLIERSRQHASAELRNDHLRGKRAAIYTPTAGPSRHELRVQQDIDGVASTLEPHDIGWGLNAMTVGGGTRLWQAQAWRFLPEDFQMASVYGTPKGSSLIDWPISYDDMAPFYELAEHEIGVCGDAKFLRHYRPQAKDFRCQRCPRITVPRSCTPRRTNSDGVPVRCLSPSIPWRDTGVLLAWPVNNASAIPVRSTPKPAATTRCCAAPVGRARRSTSLRAPACCGSNPNAPPPRA